jgi:cyclopropane fatty-acyl-phospholipid synthase-like methyltransferase
MNNQQSIEYWKKKASNNPDEKTIKVNLVNDYTQIDADFILKYTNANSEILDLASGTGLTINKFYSKVKHIDAVELFDDFSKFITKTPKITIINQNIIEYETNKQYDIITMFGIVSYFNYSEIETIYRKYHKNLRNTGKLIVKNQFGIAKDVEISGYSEELRENYFSQYRDINNEAIILKKAGYKNIEIVDIYPPECNRWNNTHFYAIIATK